jgi:hypothetical protein
MQACDGPSRKGSSGHSGRPTGRDRRAAAAGCWRARCCRCAHLIIVILIIFILIIIIIILQ